MSYFKADKEDAGFGYIGLTEIPAKYSEISQHARYVIREKYIEEQKGLCYHCHGDLKQGPPQDILEKKVTPHLYPKGFFLRPIHLHHNHDTDMTIGVVHAYCNAVLWEYYNE